MSTEFNDLMKDFFDVRESRLAILIFIDKFRPLFEDSEKVMADRWLKDQSAEFYLGMQSMMRAYHSMLMRPNMTIQDLKFNSNHIMVYLAKIIDDKIKTGEMQ